MRVTEGFQSPHLRMCSNVQATVLLPEALRPACVCPYSQRQHHTSSHPRLPPKSHQLAAHNIAAALLPELYWQGGAPHGHNAAQPPPVTHLPLPMPALTRKPEDAATLTQQQLLVLTLHHSLVPPDVGRSTHVRGLQMLLLQGRKQERQEGRAQDVVLGMRGSCSSTARGGFLRNPRRCMRPYSHWGHVAPGTASCAQRPAACCSDAPRCLVAT